MLPHHHQPSSGTRRRPQLVHAATEAALVALAGVGAFLLRFEFEIPQHRPCGKNTPSGAPAALFRVSAY